MNENKIYQGDSLEVLKTLPSESINCCVTSPPYWALRDYGVEGQLGLEPNFNDYINKLCDIFDEVKRVLRKDGTCWVNIGDTYNAHSTGKGVVGGIEGNRKNKEDNLAGNKRKINLQDKSLCNIPARFSIEMQNRGWILRNVIIWHKPNCMPSSVKDRFTVDFEYVYFFVKCKKYWFEQQIESNKNNNLSGWAKQRLKDKHQNYKESDVRFGQFKDADNKYDLQGRNKRTVWRVTPKPYKEAHFATYPKELIEPMIKAGCPINGLVLDPFFGSGTTGLVALEQNKKFIGIELNPKYIEIANKRLKPLLEQTKLI
ncbi:MAG TPA: site-specific DNA-methyltransferase [Candidatus Cloacimonas acidaminovorans]|nr:site-specific DNA-methyltransferase [Candidatus Cloacimonas acidaminovorans]